MRSICVLLVGCFSALAIMVQVPRDTAMSNLSTWYEGAFGEKSAPPFLLSPQADTVSGGISLVIVVTAIVLLVWLTWWPPKWYRRLNRDPVFDMTLGDAIAHLLSQESVYSTYQDNSHAALLAAKDIFKLACEGKISIAGAQRDDTHPQNIPKKKLSKLQPSDVCTLRSKHNPDGHIWALLPTNLKPCIEL